MLDCLGMNYRAQYWDFFISSITRTNKMKKMEIINFMQAKSLFLKNVSNSS